MKRYLATLAMGLGLALLAAACSKGGGSKEVRAQLQSESMTAAAALSSYEVQAEGEVRQGGSKAQFKLTYTYVAPDKVQWVNESTFGGKTDKAGLLVIGDQRWSLDGETWYEERTLSRDLQKYSADQIWGLIPFVNASAKGKPEQLDGFTVQRYQAERKGEGALIELIGGSLLVTEETPFQGELTDFKVDYWTEATAGFPVQMKLVATGGDRSVTVNAKLTKANDASIALAEPSAFVPRRGSTPRTGTAAQPAATQPTAAASEAAPTSTTAPAAPAATSTQPPPPPTQTAVPPTQTAVPPTQTPQPPPPAPTPAAAVAAPSTQEQAPAPAPPPPALPRSGSGGTVAALSMPYVIAGLALSLAGLSLFVFETAVQRRRARALADGEIEELRQAIASIKSRLGRG